MSQRRQNRKIARERIHLLFKEALDAYSENPSRAQRYAEMARKLGMRYKVRLPKIYRMNICRGCKKFIVPGFNSRVRLQRRREPHIVVTCFNCGKQNRMMIRKRND